MNRKEIVYSNYVLKKRIPRKEKKEKIGTLQKMKTQVEKYMKTIPDTQRKMRRGQQENTLGNR
jgi:hypothetical protein